MPSSAASAAIFSSCMRYLKLDSVMLSSKCLATLYLFSTRPIVTPMRASPFKFTACDAIADFIEFECGGPEQRFTLVTAQARQLQVATGDAIQALQFANRLVRDHAAIPNHHHLLASAVLPGYTDTATGQPTRFVSNP